jgi:hypothetical protein
MTPPPLWQSDLIGSTVRDTATGRVGRLMDRYGTRYRVRPLGGGREWGVDSFEVIERIAAKHVNDSGRERLGSSARVLLSEAGVGESVWIGGRKHRITANTGTELVFDSSPGPRSSR